MIYMSEDSQPLNEFRLKALEDSVKEIGHTQTRMEQSLTRLESMLLNNENMRADVESLKQWRYYIAGICAAFSTAIAIGVHFLKR